MVRRLFSTESRARTNARRSLSVMQQRRADATEAQTAVDAAAVEAAGSTRRLPQRTA